MTKTGLEFGILVIGICPSTLLRVVSPSTLLRTVSLSKGLSNHLIFVIWNLEFILLHYPGRGYLDKAYNPVAASAKQTDRTKYNV